VLEKHDVRCTFFILGEVAERFPDCVKRIHAAGHEIGSHSYRHLPLYQQEQGRFEVEMRQSLDFLAELTGEKVLGFRAPFFSLRADSLWAIDSLKRLGFVYDSSINPTVGVFHGSTVGGRLPFTHQNGLREFPITTVSVLGLSLPFGGGVYYRLLPYWAIRRGLEKINRENVAGNIYFHPREFDPDLPRLKAGVKMKLIVYAGTKSLESKLERMLEDFEFCPMREFL
jgi:polysaccharide deacetylase family protein (PEP-CTERM system associated)